MLHNDNSCDFDFEKMKQDLVDKGFDWGKGWALIPFAAAFGSMFNNPNDTKGND